LQASCHPLTCNFALMAFINGAFWAIGPEVNIGAECLNGINLRDLAVESQDREMKTFDRIRHPMCHKHYSIHIERIQIDWIEPFNG
jgi:hypothetical protein